MKQHQKRKQRQLEQDNALAEAIEAEKREKEAMEREVQRICEADPSLRDLQEKLRVNKNWWDVYLTNSLLRQLM